MMFTVCIIGLLMSIFTAVTFVFYPERRKWPSILILHITFAAMLGSFAGTMCTCA